MKTKPIQITIKKCCTRGLLLPTLFILLMLFLFYLIRFHNIFSPATLENANDISTYYKQNNRYVEFTFDELYYTNYDYVIGNKIVGYYYYTITDHTSTFVLISSDHLETPNEVLTNYSAKAKLTASDSMYKQMIELLAKELNWNAQGLMQSSSPFVINELEYHEYSYLLLLIAMLILTAFSVYLIGINLLFIVKPELHPSIRRLKKYGDRIQILENVNQEMYKNVNITSNNTFLTDHFYIDISMLSITIIPLDQILWAYEHTTWKRLLWIKMRLHYTLNIVAKHRMKDSSHRNTKENIEKMLEYLHEKHSDILIGFSKENKELMKKM